MSRVPQKTLVNVGAARASTWFIQNSLDACVGLQGDTLGFVNDTWTTLTGWTRQESIGAAYWDLVHPDDVESMKDAVRPLALGEQVVLTCRIAAKSGAWLWVRHHTVRGGEGWLLMILRDITAERQREIDNEEARRIAAMVRGAAGITVWRYDPVGDEYSINPDFTEHAHETPVASRLGEAVRGSVHWEDLTALNEAWSGTLATGEAGSMEYREWSTPYGWRRLRVTWQGVRPHQSGLWDIIGIAEDVTALTNARDAAQRGEEAARAATQAKSQFLANISHEFRTPMNGVLGILHLLKGEPVRKERQRLVDQALAAGGGLSDLLNDIIDYAAIEAGRLELAPEPLDPAEKLATIIATFQPVAEAKGVQLSASCADDIGWVAADPPRLRKILFHLIGNAVKFTHQGTVVARLSATGEGELRRLRLEVEDTGVGVPLNAQAGLFEKFKQGDSSTTRQYGGPGLGLAITRRLAELMGGAVGFTTEPGKGSTFWAEIAAPAASVAANDETPGDDAWLAGVRVLVVEDNPTNRLVATRMLSQLGAEVSTANNGAQGVAAVEAQDFDLIFMDIQMPVMDGVEATQRIRAMPAPKGQVPIVATTANVMPKQLAVYRACGISGVVAKPISPAALLTEVARVANDAEAA
ncbi:MAG: ATP-binding protein [Caulobacterales bacterium]